MSQLQCVRLRVQDVCEILGCSKSFVWRQSRKNPNFPQKHSDGTRITYWLRPEVEAYAMGKPYNNAEEAE